MEGANYLGAAVFWSYNAAALILTSIVVYTIATLPTKHGVAQDRRKYLTSLFGCLAATSFAVLSGNMLNVLIRSFGLWSKQHASRGTESILSAVWEWSVTSNLFLDFGEAIVADRARFVWTQSALYATMAVCLYMGIEGNQTRVPRLYAFFALSQILPISFAQNLFYLALLRLPSSPAKENLAMRPAATATVLLAYCNSIALAPSTAGTSMLIPLILIARMLLLAPLYLPTATTGAQDSIPVSKTVKALAVLALGATLWQSYQALQQHTLGELGTALFSHPAVSSLGCDFIISLISFAAWTSSQHAGGKTTEASKKNS